MHAVAFPHRAFFSLDVRPEAGWMAGHARVLEPDCWWAARFPDRTDPDAIHRGRDTAGMTNVYEMLEPLLANVGKPTHDGFGLWEGMLPTSHRAFLNRFNGATAYHGSLRMLGRRDEPYLDLTKWNDSSTWRFAWPPEVVDPYVFFAGTAWGDQYAYRRSGESLEPQVYLLESLWLYPDMIAGSFEEFLEHEFLRMAREPYEPRTSEAVRVRGAIDPGWQWAHAPSPALGGLETIDHIVELPAVTAMIYGGDIVSALEESGDDAVPVGVQPWTDERGCERLRVQFER